MDATQTTKGHAMKIKEYKIIDAEKALKQIKDDIEKMGHDDTLEQCDLDRIHKAYFAVAQCVWRWNKTD